MSDLLEAVEVAEENIQRLADPVALRNAAEQVVELARSCGARAVLAASPAAERLVGALLSTSTDLVGLTADIAAASGLVLVVDVNLASGTCVAQAARCARQAGAQQIHAVVLHQVTAAAAGAAECGVDVLSVLGSKPAERPLPPNGSGLW